MPALRAEGSSSRGQQAAKALSEAYEAVAEFVKPSVVQIRTVQKKAGGMGGLPGLPPNMRRFQVPPRGNENVNPRDFEEMLRRFLNPEGNPQGNPEKEQFGFRNQGVGSGFVFDNHGHILTNNHVVEELREDRRATFLRQGTGVLASRLSAPTSRATSLSSRSIIRATRPCPRAIAAG